MKKNRNNSETRRKIENKFEETKRTKLKQVLVTKIKINIKIITKIKEI